MRRAVIAELTRRAIKQLDDENATPVDYVVEWVENGKTLQSLAEEMAQVVGDRVWATSMKRWLEIVYPGATARIDGARPKGAHALVEDSLDIVDAAGDTPAAVAKAKLRADTRLAIAGKWNRAEFGNDRSSSVTVNIGSLHMDALRAANHAARATVVAPLAPAISGSVEMTHLPAGQLVTDLVTEDVVVEPSEPEPTT